MECRWNSKVVRTSRTVWRDCSDPGCKLAAGADDHASGAGLPIGERARGVDDALIRYFVADLPAGQTKSAHHRVPSIGRAAGKDQTSAGGRRVPTRVVHTLLANEPQAKPRSCAEDATSQVLGKAVHVDVGQAIDGCPGIVA